MTTKPSADPQAPPSKKPLDPGKIPPVIIHGPLPDVLPDLVPRRYVPEAGAASQGAVSEIDADAERKKIAAYLLSKCRTMPDDDYAMFEAGWLACKIAAAAKTCVMCETGEADAFCAGVEWQAKVAGQAMAGEGVMPNERLQTTKYDVVGAAQSNQNTPTWDELYEEWLQSPGDVDLDEWLVEVKIPELVREAKK